MTAPIDPQERIRLHLQELGASFGLDELTDSLTVPLGAAGTAVITFAEVEADVLVIINAVLLEDVSATPADARPLAEWTVGLRGARLCFDPHTGVLSAQTELLGSYADPPEVGFALAAVHAALGLAPQALDLVGGRAPDVVDDSNEPTEWWPQDDTDPADVLQRIRAMLGDRGVEPVLDESSHIVLVSPRGLLIWVEPSEDGRFLELRATIAEQVDPRHPAVSETLATNLLIAFGGLSVVPADRTVVVEPDLLTSSLDPSEFFAALDSLAAVADGFCDSIAQALGGRPATVSQVDGDSSGWSVLAESSSGSSAGSFLLASGRMVGEYEIEDELGAGAFGTVYRAKDPRLPRSVALKVLKPHWVFEPEVRDRFLKEARLAARINHPHLVKVHAVGEDGDFVFVAYDLVSGESLERILEDEGGLEPFRASRIVQQIAGALQALHDEGFIHRDIKPANVMVWRPGSALEAAVVLDLGVAHGYEDPDAIRETVHAPGTLYFQAPEVERGVTADPGLDQYALALTAFEMLTGHAAFAGVESLYELHERKVRGSIESLIDHGVDNQRLESVLRRALDPDPAQRFASVEAFADEFEDAVLAAFDERDLLSKDEGGNEGPSTLEPYAAWPVEETPDPLTASPGALAEPMLRLIEVEGPIVAERAFRLMLEGSGRRQLSSGVEKRLASAVRRLVRDGSIEAEQEWQGRRSRNAVLRPAGSAPARPRKLGPRRLDEVPPRELAAAAEIAVGRSCNEITDDITRAVLAIYGRQRASQPFLDQLAYALDRYGAARE